MIDTLFAFRWKREVKEAVALCGDHLSLYQLTLEPGTALWLQVRAGECVCVCVCVCVRARACMRVRVHLPGCDV